MMPVRMMIAFCIGLAMLYVAQHAWLTGMADRVTAQEQAPTPFFSYKPVVPTARFTADQVVPELPPIDSSAGERAGVENAARQADIIRRHALSLVPLH